MNKYLLCVLLSFTPIPALSASDYIYDLVEGTMDVSDYFAKDSSKPRYALDEWGEGLAYIQQEYKYTNQQIPFTMQWDSFASSEFVQYDPDFTFRVYIPGMASFEKYNDIASSGPIDMGVHTLPSTPVNTEYNCTVPMQVTSDHLIQGRIYVVFSSQIRGTIATGMSSIGVTCIGYYELRQSVELSLADKEINLIGTQPTQLTGTTIMYVKGTGGEVTVDIDNPSQDDVSVSFEPDRVATSTRVNLTGSWAPSEQKIYVRGKSTKPGSHSYTVRLKASFK